MLIDDYFIHQINFEKKYGKKTIVLMQVGSFFEFYGVNNNYEKIGDSQTVAELLRVYLNKEDAVIAEHPIFTEKMQSVLKCWMYAFGNITRSADEFWNELTQEERYERIAHLALPESINLEWHIFSVED